MSGEFGDTSGMLDMEIDSRIFPTATSAAAGDSPGSLGATSNAMAPTRQNVADAATSTDSVIIADGVESQSSKRVNEGEEFANIAGRTRLTESTELHRVFAGYLRGVAEGRSAGAALGTS